MIDTCSREYISQNLHRKLEVIKHWNYRLYLLATIRSCLNGHIYTPSTLIWAPPTLCSLSNISWNIITPCIKCMNENHYPTTYHLRQHFAHCEQSNTKKIKTHFKHKWCVSFIMLKFSPEHSVHHLFLLDC